MVLLNIGTGDNKISAKTTSSGQWYINDLTVADDGIFNKIDVLDKAIEKVELVMNKHNKKDGDKGKK